MKKLLFAIVALFIVAIAAVLVAFFSINSIAKKAIETGGSYALGVKTTLDSANVGLLSGTFSMKELNVANPSGFTSPSFLSLGSGGVSVSLASLRQPVVHLPSLSMDNLAVSLEKKNSQSNYKVILDNLEKLKSATGGGGGSSAPSGNEKKFIIDELVLKNIQITLDLVGGPGAIGELTKLKVPIDEIKLEHVGQTGSGVAGSGVTMAQLCSIIVQAVLAAGAEKGGGIFPADILGDLNGSLASLGQLDQLGLKVVGGAQAEIQKAGEKVIDDAAKKVQDAAGDAAKSVQDLLGGKKKK